MNEDIGTQLGRRERQIVEVLYRLGKAGVAEVLAELPDPPSYSAVRGMLTLLEEKGHVRRDRSTHAHRFTAVIDRDTIVGQRLRGVAEKLTGGLIAPLLTHLVKAETLSAEERDQLRSLIDDLDRTRKK